VSLASQRQQNSLCVFTAGLVAAPRVKLHTKLSDRNDLCPNNFQLLHSDIVQCLLVPCLFTVSFTRSSRPVFRQCHVATHTLARGRRLHPAAAGATCARDVHSNEYDAAHGCLCFFLAFLFLLGYSAAACYDAAAIMPQHNQQPAANLTDPAAQAGAAQQHTRQQAPISHTLTQKHASPKPSNYAMLVKGGLNPCHLQQLSKPPCSAMQAHKGMRMSLGNLSTAQHASSLNHSHANSAPKTLSAATSQHRKAG
jgi:hypothetical protein